MNAWPPLFTCLFAGCLLALGCDSPTPHDAGGEDGGLLDSGGSDSGGEDSGGEDSGGSDSGSVAEDGGGFDAGGELVIQDGPRLCEFEPVDLGTTDTLWTVWAASETDVWAASGEHLFHFTGSSAERIDLDEPGAVRGLDGRADGSTVYLASNRSSTTRGLISRWSGGVVETVYTHPSNWLAALWVSPSGQAWAAGEQVVRSDGGAWEEIAGAPDTYISSITGRAGDDGLFLGRDRVYAWRGGPDLVDVSAAPTNLAKIVARAGGRYWGVSPDTLWVSDDGSAWSVVRDEALDVGPFAAIAVDANQELWLVNAGEALEYTVEHYDGTVWTRYPLDFGATFVPRGLTIAGDDIWVVGHGGAARCVRP